MLKDLPFYLVCDLFEALETLRRQQYPPSQRRDRAQQLIRQWLQHQDLSIVDHAQIEPLSALLSVLFPEKRSDRVYSLQQPSLARILKRALRLGIARQQQFDHWLAQTLHPRTHFRDLGHVVERILQEAEFPAPPKGHELTVVELNRAFDAIAARSRYSAPRLRRLPSDDGVAFTVIAPLLLRLQSREAKWLTRLLLKDVATTTDLSHHQGLILRSISPRLDVSLQMYDDLNAAVESLLSGKSLEPQIGIKVRAPQWAKPQGGIAHAVSLANKAVMDVEQKYDGEYCQVHVDLSLGDECIRIFSKSGKESTTDRKNLHPWIKQALRIGQPECRINSKCIFEGEMLLWSDQENKIMEFHKIRKHIRRGGTRIGVSEDSPAYSWEHLMLIVHDLLLLDDFLSLHETYERRRRVLNDLLDPISARLEISPIIGTIDFSHRRAKDDLARHLGHSLAHRWEGLVLKPRQSPYFGSGCRWIKMKQDCIQGLGDTADFAVVGAAYDFGRAMEIGDLQLSWTHFFIGCCMNKPEVVNGGAKPAFKVVDAVTNCISKADFQQLSIVGRNQAVPSTRLFDLDFIAMDPKTPKMQVSFALPFVFEIAGSGFDKRPDREIFALRFPRVVKIYWDRHWHDAVDLMTLQELADHARRVPRHDLHAEAAAWEQQIRNAGAKSLDETSLASTTVSASMGSSIGNAAKTRNLYSLQSSHAKLTKVQSSHAELTSLQPSHAELIRVDSGERHAPSLDDDDAVGGKEIGLTRKRRRSSALQEIVNHSQPRRLSVKAVTDEVRWPVSQSHEILRTGDLFRPSVSGRPLALLISASDITQSQADISLLVKMIRQLGRASVWDEDHKMWVASLSWDHETMQARVVWAHGKEDHLASSLLEDHNFFPSSTPARSTLSTLMKIKTANLSNND